MQQHLFQVGKRHVLVDIKTLNLVEEAVGTGSDCLVAVNATRADDADGRLVALHSAYLYRAGVAAQHDIAGDVLVILLDEEGVLHVAGGVVGSEVQRTEYVPVVLNLGTISNGKAQTREDVNNLLAHHRDGVTCSQFSREGRTGDVNLVLFLGLLLGSLAQGIDLLGSKVLQLVELLAQLTLLLGSHLTELVEQSRNFTLLAQILDT